MSDEESAPDVLNIERCNNAQETRSLLTERWQDIFFSSLIDNDLDTEQCTHGFFLKACKHRQSLVFDSNGKLTSEALDQLTERYEDCLTSGYLTFQKLQTGRFADAIIEVSDNGKNRSEQAVGWESRSSVGGDSSDETSHLQSASDASSDVADSTALSDIEDETQLEIDAEEILERLLVKRGSLIHERLLTDENDLVLETA